MIRVTFGPIAFDAIVGGVVGLMIIVELTDELPMANAVAPMLFTDDPTTIRSITLQPRNALCPIVVTLSGIVTDFSL